jgi:hypothetical protein
MRRYKDDQLNRYYQNLRTLGSPTALEQAGIFGAVLASFKRGFGGLPRAKFVVRNSFAWVAYYAGRDSTTPATQERQKAEG